MNLTFNLTDFHKPALRVLDVKETCSGIVGEPLMVLIASLLFFNVFVVLFWHRIRSVKIPLGSWKELDLAYFVPVVNFCFLVFIFQYAFNLW